MNDTSDKSVQEDFLETFFPVPASGWRILEKSEKDGEALSDYMKRCVCLVFRIQEAADRAAYFKRESATCIEGLRQEDPSRQLPDAHGFYRLLVSGIHSNVLVAFDYQARCLKADLHETIDAISTVTNRSATATYDRGVRILGAYRKYLDTAYITGTRSRATESELSNKWMDFLISVSLTTGHLVRAMKNRRKDHAAQEENGHAGDSASVQAWKAEINRFRSSLQGTGITPRGPELKPNGPERAGETAAGEDKLPGGIPSQFVTEETRDIDRQSMEWDVFISHASEDKEVFVRPLAAALRKKDMRVWFDEFSLTVGDSLRRSIDQGLARSRYGIVVISPDFLKKEWPQKELDGLFAREVDDRKVILPVWHNVDEKTVRQYSPLLADRVATSTAKGVDAVVADLMKAMK